jgi:hypothetical protein
MYGHFVSLLPRCYRFATKDENEKADDRIKTVVGLFYHLLENHVAAVSP